MTPDQVKRAAFLMELKKTIDAQSKADHIDTLRSCLKTAAHKLEKPEVAREANHQAVKALKYGLYTLSQEIEVELAQLGVGAPRTFKVIGSYGELTADFTTGKVLSYDSPGQTDGYDDIEVFDVVEMNDTFGSLFTPDTTWDVVLIGYTTRTGQYELPDRKTYLEVRVDDQDVVTDPYIAAMLKKELR